MNKWLSAAVIIIVLVLGAWYFTHNKKQAPMSGTATTTEVANMGTYSYECDEHVSFTMTPSSDMGSIAIAPASSSATFPPKVTVYKEPVSTGVRYVGSGLLFSAHGETVTLSEGDSAINCSPVPDAQNAPFNFGD